MLDIKLRLVWYSVKFLRPDGASYNGFEEKVAYSVLEGKEGR